MDALPPQPDTPKSAGWGEDPWRGQNVGFMNTPSSPPSSMQMVARPEMQVAARPDMQVAATAAFPVNFDDAFQTQVSSFLFKKCLICKAKL